MVKWPHGSKAWPQELHLRFAQGRDGRGPRRRSCRARLSRRHSSQQGQAGAQAHSGIGVPSPGRRSIRKSVGASPVRELELVQERFDLESELATMQAKVDPTTLEAGFVKVAAAYSKRKGISYAAWRAVGVEPYGAEAGRHQPRRLTSASRPLSAVPRSHHHRTGRRTLHSRPVSWSSRCSPSGCAGATTTDGTAPIPTSSVRTSAATSSSADVVAVGTESTFRRRRPRRRAVRLRLRRVRAVPPRPAPGVPSTAAARLHPLGCVRRVHHRPVRRGQRSTRARRRQRRGRGPRRLSGVDGVSRRRSNAVDSSPVRCCASTAAVASGWPRSPSVMPSVPAWSPSTCQPVALALAEALGADVTIDATEFEASGVGELGALVHERVGGADVSVDCLGMRPPPPTRCRAFAPGPTRADRPVPGGDRRVPRVAGHPRRTGGVGRARAVGVAVPRGLRADDRRPPGPCGDDHRRTHPGRPSRGPGGHGHVRRPGVRSRVGCDAGRPRRRNPRDAIACLPAGSALRERGPPCTQPDGRLAGPPSAARRRRRGPAPRHHPPQQCRCQRRRTDVHAHHSSTRIGDLVDRRRTRLRGRSLRLPCRRARLVGGAGTTDRRRRGRCGVGPPDAR